MKRLQLILGTVNTLPAGSSEIEAETYYQRCLRPVVKAFYQFPRIHFTLHFSGVLLEYLERVHGEYISALSEMTRGNRHIELLLGGYFEPIFPLIPRADRVGQIEQLSTSLRKTFGRRWRGAWVSEQIWEQEIVSSLSAAGAQYTFLDDSLFSRAGVEAKDVYFPAITEDQAKTLLVFPINSRLRKKFWYASPAEIVDDLVACADEQPGKVLTLLVDGEAGPWKGEDAEEERGAWLTQFLNLLAAQQDKRIVDSVQPARYLKQTLPRSRVYFPASIWDEMRIHPDDSDAAKEFQKFTKISLPGLGRRGYFYGKEIRQSIARYPEANLLYSKMHYVHSLVNQIRGDTYRKNAAREELWRGQSNTPYWHGKRGGVYSNTERKSAWTALIKAEKQSRDKANFMPSLLSLDFDMDGWNEVMYQGSEINAYVHSQGGCLFELDYLPLPFNYLDTLTRTPEPYHRKDDTDYDHVLRRTFVDHLLAPGTDIDAFARSNYAERGELAARHWGVEDLRRDALTLKLSTETPVTGTRVEGALNVRKTYVFNRATIQVTYQFLNIGNEGVDALFAPEVNLSFLSNAEDDLRAWRKEARSKAEEFGRGQVELPPCPEVYFEDLKTRAVVHCAVHPVVPWWHIPVYSAHQDSGVTVQTYQQTCLVPRIPLQLKPGESREVTITLSITRYRASSAQP